MTAYKSFKEALAKQKKIASKITEKDHAMPLKDAARVREAGNVDELVPPTDPRTAGIINSRLRRSGR